MNSADAAALELFIRDHDTRFVPKAQGDGEDACVLLKKPDDGEELEVRSVAEYHERFIEASSPGPTIEKAWEEWMAGRSRR